MSILEIFLPSSEKFFSGNFYLIAHWTLSLNKFESVVCIEITRNYCNKIKHTSLPPMYELQVKISTKKIDLLVIDVILSDNSKFGR